MQTRARGRRGAPTDAARVASRTPPASRSAAPVSRSAAPSRGLLAAPRGREKQAQKLYKDLSRALFESSGGSGHVFYLLGQPGTGKTLTIGRLKDHFIQVERRALRYVMVNVLTLGRQNVITRVVRELYKAVGASKGLKGGLSTAEMTASLTRYFSMKGRSKTPLLLVLDEFDNLTASNQVGLYTIFEWTQMPHSCFTLVCIANSLVLNSIESIPRCQSRLGTGTIYFSSYTWEELYELSLDHFPTLRATLDGGACPAAGPVFTREALEFLCRRCAAKSGDARTCLSLINNILASDVSNVTCDVVSQQMAALHKSKLSLFFKDILPPKVSLYLLTAVLLNLRAANTAQAIDVLSTFQRMSAGQTGTVTKFTQYVDTLVGSRILRYVLGTQLQATNNVKNMYESHDNTHTAWGQWQLLLMLTIPDAVECVRELSAIDPSFPHHARLDEIAQHYHAQLE